MNKALLVGVDVYERQPALAGCVADVADVQTFLTSRGVVDAADIVVLADARATRRAIVDALAELVASLGPGDCGYVHFSGYGARMPSQDVRERDGMDEVLCPHDFAWTSHTALADHDVLAILGSLASDAHVILSIDASCAGDFLRGFGTRGRPRALLPPAGVRSRGPTVQGFRAAAQAPNVTVLSACSRWQTATEAAFDGTPRGVFTYHFVEALRTNTSTLADTIAAIAPRLERHAMTPIASNAELPYVAAPGMPGAYASPLRTSAAVLAGAIVFEQSWMNVLRGRNVETTVRISEGYGELTAAVVVRGFGGSLGSPPIDIAGDRTLAIALGPFSAQVIVTVSRWSARPDAIDFVLQIELASYLPFEPRVSVTRVPVHVDLRRSRGSARSFASPIDLLSIFHGLDVPR